MNKQIKKICESIDSRIKIEKDKKIEFAKLNGYKSFALYVYEEYKTRSATNILKDIQAFGIKKVTNQTISNIKFRVQDDLKTLNPKKQKGYCKTGCGRKIADDNWWYCKKCEGNNKRVNVDREFYHIHI